MAQQIMLKVTSLFFTFIFYLCNSFLLFWLATAEASRQPVCSRSVVWKEIDLVYEKTYPYKCNQKHIHIPGCLCKSIAGQLNTLSVLNCKEHAKLLRPERSVLTWQREESLNGFVSLNIPELGIDHAHARIVSIRLGRRQTQVMRDGSQPVTGLFIRHVFDVRKYTFTNLQTGQPGTINATPEHRFYVKNLQTFVPVAEIAGTDKLITDTGGSVQLSCHRDRQKHCGRPRHAREPVYVYNLEVAQHHAYFAGSLHILVHNTYVITRYPSGETKYHGEMKDNRYHGTGTLYARNQEKIYKGEWKNGDRHGEGTEYQDKDLPEYEGQWKHDQREGIGTSYKANGQKNYYGGWMNDMHHGEGTRYGDRNEPVSFGKWKKNRLMQGFTYIYAGNKIIGRQKVSKTYAAALCKWYENPPRSTRY